MKNKLTYILGVAALCISPVLLFSQQYSQKKYYSFEKIETKAPWLISGNGAGLVFNRAQNYANVRGYFNSESGSYQNYNTPEKSSFFGIETKSYTKVNKVFFYGSFNYEYGANQNQAWNGTVYRGSTLNPILDSIPGKNLRESYIMSAKVGYPLNDKFAVGAAIDYNTSTMAKRVDGRNENTLSMMTLSPGITYRSGALSLGLNLTYRRDIEAVKYSFIGDVTGKNIYYFEGLWFYTSSGISSTTNLNRYYHKDLFGSSVQLQYNNDKVCIFNEFSAERGHENDFDEAQYDKRFANTQMLNYRYKGRVRLKGDGADHLLSLMFRSDENASYYVVNNYEPIPGELSQWSYFEYGKVLRYVTGLREYGVEYKTIIRDADWSPSWILAAGYNRVESDRDYRVFPAQYNQNFYTNSFYARVSKELELSKKSLLTLDLNGAYRKGDGVKLEATNPLVGGSLKQQEAILTQEYNYNIAQLYSTSIGARYTILQKGDGNRSLFFGGLYNHIETKELGSRGFFSLSVGMNF